MSMKDALEKAGARGSRTRASSAETETDRLPPIIFREGEHRSVKLITTIAKEYAEALASGDMTQTQLRRYYNEVKALEARIEATQEYEAQKAAIAMLKPKVAYGAAKEKSKEKRRGFLPLQRIIDAGVDWATKEDSTPKHFQDFSLFFEAVVGFFRGKER
jgi:CRISPR type III-A-associated protein Csm2